MSEQVADLRERHAALDQARRVLVPQVVPVQVDLLERHAVRLQHRGDPGGPEAPDRFTDLVAEDQRIIRLPIALRIEP